MDFSLCCCPGLDFRRFFRARRSAALCRRPNENHNRTSGSSERTDTKAIENPVECGDAFDARVQNSNHTQCAREHELNRIDAEEGTLNHLNVEDEEVKPTESDSGNFQNVALEDDETQNDSSIIESAETEILNHENIETENGRQEHLPTKPPGTTVCDPVEPLDSKVQQNGNIEKELLRTARSEGEHDDPEGRVQSIDALKAASATMQQDRIKYFIVTCMVDACIIAFILYIYYSLWLD